MISVIETLKVYMISIEYPQSVNDPSPAKSIPLAGDWRIEDAVPSRRNVRQVHRYVGLVLSYDPSTQVAVIFLGSSAPWQPQRCIPWEGTPRLAYQTDKILRVVGRDFRNHPGYMNFSHAMRVLILQPNEVSSAMTPGLACILDILDRSANPPKALEIQLLDGKIDLLKSLHGAYWSGVRYPVGGGGEGGVVQGLPACTGVEGLPAQTRGGSIDGATKSSDNVAELSYQLG